MAASKFDRAYFVAQIHEYAIPKREYLRYATGSSRSLDAFTPLWQPFPGFRVLVVLVDQTASEAPADPGNFSRVKGDTLRLGHFDRDRIEFPEELCAAALLQPAGAQSAEESGDVPRPDLPEFNLLADETSGQLTP